MSGVVIDALAQVHFAEDLQALAENCVTQALRVARNADSEDADASLAAKNWAGAALQATQAWMTTVRGPGR